LAEAAAAAAAANEAASIDLTSGASPLRLPGAAAGGAAGWVKLEGRVKAE